SLAGGDGGAKGVDSTADAEAALDAALRLSRDTGAVVAVTGAVDRVTDGERVLEVHNGHELQTRVTGMGCTATAVVAGCLAARAADGDAVAVTAHALGLFGFAAERAARGAAGPGSFAVALLDSLYGLTEPQVLAGVRIR